MYTRECASKHDTSQTNYSQSQYQRLKRKQRRPKQTETATKNYNPGITGSSLIQARRNGHDPLTNDGPNIACSVSANRHRPPQKSQGKMGKANLLRSLRSAVASAEIRRRQNKEGTEEEKEEHEQREILRIILYWLKL